MFNFKICLIFFFNIWFSFTIYNPDFFSHYYEIHSQEVKYNELKAEQIITEIKERYNSIKEMNE